MKYTKNDIIPGFKFIDERRNCIQTVAKVYSTGITYKVRCMSINGFHAIFQLGFLLSCLNTGTILLTLKKEVKTYDIF